MKNKVKNLWYLCPWDAVENEAGFDRSLSILKSLNDSSLEVTWWNTSFSHAEKKFRENTKNDDSFDLILLPAIRYASNTGFKRLISSVLLFAFFFQIKSIFKKKPDLIFLSGPVVFVGVYTLLLKLFFRTKVIVELRDLWPEGSVNQSTGLRKVIYIIISIIPHLSRALTFMISDYIIYLNENFKNYAIKRYPFIKNTPSIIAYPSPIIDFSSIKNYYSNEFKKGDNDVWAIYSGTLGGSQNQELFIKSIPHIKKENREKLKIFISGDGSNKFRLVEIVKKLQLTNIVFTGYLNKKDYLHILKNADFGVSFYQSHSPVSFPTKIMDYLNSGLPIIMSNSQKDAAKVVSQNNCGSVIDEDDIYKIANAVDLMFVKKKYNIYKLNVEKIKSNFSSTDQVSKISKFIKDCTD
jgi:UDP-N-acetylglucosamine:LPS N-acetylglucosamine transferase